MSQAHSKTDVLAHAGTNLDQRTQHAPLSTAQQKNSLSAEVQHEKDLENFPKPGTVKYSENAGNIDDQLNAEDNAEIARKQEAKTQSAIAHGKDV